jgi:hypothetical protein
MALVDLGAYSDRVRIDYTSAISADCRAAILSSILTIIGRYGYHHAAHIDKVTGHYVVSVTKYDPDASRPCTDAEAIQYLRSVAAEAGVPLAAIVDAMRSAAREE